MADTTRQQAEQSAFIYVRDVNTGKIRHIGIPSPVQIGLKDNPAELVLLGRFAINVTGFDTSSTTGGDIYISNDDTIVNVSLTSTPNSGRIAVHLPSSPRTGQLHFIKDVSGTAGTVPIDVTPNPGSTIDGDPLMTISANHGSLAVYWSGEAWQLSVAGAQYSTFSGSVEALGGIRGSLQELTDGTSYLVAGTNITIVTQSNGSILISATGGGGGSSAVWFDGGNRAYSTSSISIDPLARFVSTIGSDIHFFVSGTIGLPSSSASRKVSVFGGDLRVSGSVTVGTGSITITGNDIQFGAFGTRIEKNGADLKFFDLSNPTGRTLSSMGTGGGGGADVSASYITISNTGSLPNERALTAGTGISITDNGAGSTVIINALSGSAAALPKIDNLIILARKVSTDQSFFDSVSAFEFNPNGPETMAPSASTSYVAYFQPIVEVFPTGVTIETQLYNVTTNAYVANSLLSSSVLATTRLRSINLSGSLASGSNVYEMHMRITNANVGQGTCKGAKLFVTWT